MAAHAFWANLSEKGTKMPRPTPLDVEMDVVRALEQGVKQSTIASDLGLAQSTVSRIKHKYELAARNEEERMKKDMVIAGNKHDGRFISATDSRDTYIGECRLPNGKMRSKRFHASGRIVAQRMWEKWCEETLAESQAEELGPEPFAKEPTQPVEDETVWVVDAEDEQADEVVEPSLSDEEPVEERLAEADGPKSEEVEVAMPKTMYVIFLPDKGPLKNGAFTDMVKALSIADNLNTGLAFAGVESRYEVEEVTFWGE